MEEEIEKSTWKISDLKDELLQKHRDHLSVGGCEEMADAVDVMKYLIAVN